MKARVLIVDDEETIRKLLNSRMDREGYDVKVASNGDEADRILGDGVETGVVVTDIRMPGKDGFQVMKEVHAKNPQARVIMITGHGEKELAIRALREGAADYLEKPFDLDELSHAVKRGMNEYHMARENRDLVGRLEARIERVEGKDEDRYWFVSKASAMQKVNEWLNVLRRESMRGNAEEPAVLIMGESGTGKEGIARMIHSGSRRARGPWVAVNCANFSEQLLESELFGHEKGSFTGATSMKRGLFEIARGGTLFLDEMGEMDVKLQAKLLRVIQEKVLRRVGGTVDIETDVRVVAATNRDLESRVKSGKFREDLYHRVAKVVVEVPALRERGEDCVLMARQFAERAFHARGKDFKGFAADAEAVIKGYHWPGNVRELMNVMERVALLSETSGTVTAKALGLSNKTTSSAAAPSNGVGLRVVSEIPQGETELESAEDSYMALKKRWCDSFEKEFISRMLDKCEGNVSAAARESKLDRSNFLRLMRRHGIQSEGFKKNTGDSRKAA